MHINGLSKLYVSYSTFAISRYGEDCPVRVFQRYFPFDHYSIDIEHFLKSHDYRPIRRGADLPWWGKKYFSNSSGKRVMVISQDSLAHDAGSITFFAHLIGYFDNKYSYDKYCSHHNENQRFRYSSWNRIKRHLLSWGVDFDFLYATDASKVYQTQVNKLDRKLSKKLLVEEIQYCRPNLLILLGSAPLRLLSDKFKFDYRDVVDAGEFIVINGIQTVVTPFPSGNGLTQTNFAERMEKASALIKTAVKE